jgi:hypothetical protein
MKIIFLASIWNFVQLTNYLYAQSIRIEVKDEQAKLYPDNNKQPSLIVNDLKHGAGLSGAVGLWVEVGTEGFFSDLKVHRYE